MKSLSRWPDGRRAAAFHGIAFAVLSAAIFPAVAPDLHPTLGSNAESVLAFHAAHRLPFLIANYLGVVAMLPGLVKVAYLAARFRQAEEKGGWLWILVLASGIFALAIGTADLMTFQTIPFLAKPGLEVGAKVLSDLASSGFALFLVAEAGFTFAIVWATIATRALPRWVAWVGIPVGGVALIGSLGSVWTPGVLAGGGVISCIGLGAFLVWFAGIDLVFLGFLNASETSVEAVHDV